MAAGNLTMTVAPFQADQTYEEAPLREVLKKCVKVIKVRCCVSLKVDADNSIMICLSIAGAERCFLIDKDGCFKLRIKVITIEVCVSGFSDSDGKLCFDLRVKACVGAFGIDKCLTIVSEKVCIPAGGAGPMAMLSYRDEAPEAQLLQLQAMSALLDDNAE